MILRPVVVFAILTAALQVPLLAGELSLAVRMEDAAAFSKAIKAGVPLDELDPSGRTPLFYAVVTRKPAVVKTLLDAGAKASVSGQAREPLWAAVVNGDEAIISMLLKSGADPGAGTPGWRPVDAAVLSGRVAVLKALIAAKPDLEIPAKIPEIREGNDANSSMVVGSSGTAVEDAILSRHLEMAKFLIEQGVHRGDSKSLNQLIYHASGIQPEVPRELIEALLKAGANPNAYVVPPWNVEALGPRCGADVAARLGRAALLDRYLNGATAPQGFFNRLLTMALTSGDAATVNVVMARSPGATPFLPKRLEKVDGFFAGPETDPRTSWDTRESGSLLLKPRRTEAPAALAAEEICVAVIAGKESENEAELLAAVLSTLEGWTVVERDKVETLLGERDFDFKQPRGLVEIGDTLNAGFLIMLSKPGKGSDRVLGAEIVDVATGMVIKRLHAPVTEFKPDAWTETLSGEISRAREDWRTSGGKMQAVTLLGVGAIPGMTGSDTARSVVSAGLMAEIDASPGCIALTRMQMGPLVEEQTLGQAGSIWQSAWTLEAGVGRPAEDKLVLRLRLKNLRSGEQFDADGEGSPKRMGDLVGDVWAGLAAKASFSEPRPAREGEAAAEGKALWEEAAWRMKLGEFDAAARLADSAHYLGHDGPATQAMRIRARIYATTVRNNEHVDRNHPDRTAEILARLPDAVEAVELMNEQLDAVVQAATDREREILRTGGNSIGELASWLGRLVGCRGSVPEVGATAEEEALARRLDEGLQRWCRAVFPKAPTWDEAGRNALPPFGVVDALDNVDLRKLPWLPEMAAEYLAESFRRDLTPRARPRNARNLGELVALLGLSSQDISDYSLKRPAHDPDAAEMVIGKLKGIDPALLARFEKEARLICARDESRAVLAEEVAALRVNDLREGRVEPVHMVRNELLSRYRVIENHRPQLLPFDEEMYCPDALSSGKPEGELLRNLEGYSTWKRSMENRPRVIETLEVLVGGAVSRELRPGAARTRARAATAARMAGLSDAEFAALVKPLPPDLERDHKRGTGSSEGVEILASLASMPAGADDFIVGRAIAQPSKGYIWWSGGLVKGVVKSGRSPDEQCLPALARVTIATGKVDVVTSPTGWGDWQRNSDKMLNPKSSMVHTDANRVVWHLPRIGLFEVNPETLALTPLIKKIGQVPTSFTNVVDAGAIIGDAFFVAENDGWQRDERGNQREGSQRVLCLRAGQDPLVLVETSRRPESTPLDAPGNQLKRIAIDGDKVRVFANADWAYLSRGIMMVEFNSGATPEVTSVSKDKAQIDRLLLASDRDKRPYAADVGMWSWGDGFSARSGGKPGVIDLRKGNEPRPVNVDFPAPAVTGGTYEVDELDNSGKPTGKRVQLTSAEFVASGRGQPMIVGETEDSLLVMQRWGSNGELPPLLWRVSKKHLEAEAMK